MSETEKPWKIFGCQPGYKNGHRASITQFLLKSTKTGRMDIADNQMSLLAHGFNHFWAAALNRQLDGENYKYFAMLHDDIIPEDWWLDTLIEDLENTGADLVSAVVMIKDMRGLTSTAITDRDDRFTIRRITMNEVFRLPEVFSGSDCGYRDDQLVVNTGCWVCRFDRPWRHEVDKLFFTINDKIVMGPMGRYVVCVEPEDWFFSRQLNAIGGKIMASRRVKNRHVGEGSFPNDKPWGDWDHDRDFAHHFGSVPICSRKEDFPCVPKNGHVKREEVLALT